MLYPLAAFMAFCLSTCNVKPNLDSVDKAICATGTTVKPDCSPVVPAEDGVVRVDIRDGRSKAVIHKSSGSTVYVEFRAEGYSKLYGNLYSKDKEANIRFTQIFMPDGSADGPFFRDIEYDLPQDGVYKIAINENIMAGDPWSGDMKVQLVFKK